MQMLEAMEGERKARREAEAEVARLKAEVDVGSSDTKDNHEIISKLKLQVRKLMAQRDRLRRSVEAGRVRAVQCTLRSDTRLPSSRTP